MQNRAAVCATLSAMKKSIAWLFACLVVPLVAVSAPKRAPTHEDIWLMKRVGAPQVSPDGRWLVASVIEPAYDDNAQLSDLWLIDTAARHSSRRLTSTRRPENGVAWSPDSKRIAFSAQRDNDEVAQIYSLDLASGGEAQRLTNLSGGARSPVYSHDGRQLAFVSLMYPQARDDATNKELIEANHARKANARIFDSFPIRSWDRWLDERQARVFVQALDEDGLASGNPRDLLAGTRLAASPGFAGRQTDTGEEIEVEFTPDNQAVVFGATTNRNEAAYAFTDSQLFIVKVSGGEPRQITTGSNTWSQPRFTPDGRTLLAVLETQGPNVYNASRVAAFPWPALDRHEVVTEVIDRSVGSFAVSPDSRVLYFTAEDGGNEKLYSVRLGGGAVQTLTHAGDKGSFTNLTIPARTGKTAAVRKLGERQRARRDRAGESGWRPGAGAHQVQRAARRAARPAAASRISGSPAAAASASTASWCGRPGSTPSKKYPLFVVIHGGPHGMWRDQFFVRWNYHLLAAPGYVLLLTNYSGSTGFGEEFARSIQGDPLKGPGRRDQRGGRRRHQADSRSSTAVGNAPAAPAMAGTWRTGCRARTTRYKCLISHAGLVNLEAQWGTSDTIYSREVNLGGPPWEQARVWREQNPIRYAAKFRTPVLVTVGENDFRVPLNNTLEYWSALQRMQVPSRLIVFPDENHWILKGEDSRLFYAEVAAWLARWLAPAAAKE